MPGTDPLDRRVLDFLSAETGVQHSSVNSVNRPSKSAPGPPVRVHPADLIFYSRRPHPIHPGPLARASHPHRREEKTPKWGCSFWLGPATQRPRTRLIMDERSIPLPMSRKPRKPQKRTHAKSKPPLASPGLARWRGPKTSGSSAQLRNPALDSLY
ncbi:uncharacterized protein N7477_004688 [Penicillium maclennaniae]|uniref:uncharacterized protein n=1 Tax=Penicillium maclennaniae TaxID=1343394 RepID=UPI00254186FF|nr:uncharacterized protein N7477_004688 [Penicillium maclennaniae]KAJ5674754.1 hypothetical protein N7477_004688 [Penicillium maclennaniae]